MSFLAELRRRNVFRMAALYVVSAWLIVQVAETLLPIFETPAWVLKTLVAMLAIGFVPTLIFAWLYELTPDGLRRDIDVRLEHSIAAQTGRRMDQLTIAVLLLVAALVAADRYWPRAGESGTEAVKGAAVPLAPAESVAPPLIASVPIPETPAAATDPKSIAVLAFADMSAGKDNEYLADGIAEEILNALAQVRDLKVAGRTSAFYFKGRNEDLRTIGKTLGVAHVLEGSVRRQGNTVRITAQLIQVKDGFHLWSESFDGDMQDVFALQERIARSIAEKLQLTLSGAQQARLVDVGTRNTEAYALFLQATSTLTRRDIANLPAAMDQLERAIALDPGYVRAHGRLALVAAVAASYLGNNFDLSQAKAERYADAAMALDPKLAEPHVALGMVRENQDRYVEARHEYQRAIQKAPDDITARYFYGNSLARAGYLRQGGVELDRALALDPLLPNALLWRGTVAFAEGDIDAAERMYRRAQDVGLAFAGLGLAEVAAARGRREDAIRHLTVANRALMFDLPDRAADVLSAGAYGDAAARAAAIAFFDEYLASKPPVVDARIAPSLLLNGEPVRALATSQARVGNNSLFLFYLLPMPIGREARALPQFAEYARAMSLADLWEEFGPPDMCRRAAAREFICE